MTRPAGSRGARVTGDLEVGAVRPQPQQEIGKSVEQRLEARFDRCREAFHPAMVVAVK